MKKFFFDIFAIHSSSRHEKRCQVSVRLFSLFRGSIYQQLLYRVKLYKSKPDQHYDYDVPKDIQNQSLKAWNENETSKTADTRTLRQPL